MQRPVLIDFLIFAGIVSASLFAGCASNRPQGNHHLVPAQRDEAPKAKISSAWSPSPVVIDGLGEEWDAQPLKDFPKIGISLGIRNDANSIYAILVTRVPPLARALSDELTLWVDGSGRRHKRYGVGIPEDSGDLYQFRIKNKQWLESLDTDERRRIEAELQTEERIAVTTPGRGTTVAINGEHGAAIALGHHDGLFCFELRFPRNWAHAEVADAIPTLGLELSIPIMSKKKTASGKMGRVSNSGQGRGGQGMGGRGKGGRGKGGQGMGGQGMGGQGMGAGKGGGRSLRPAGQRRGRGAGEGMLHFEKREIWIRIVLARKSDS